MLYFLLACTSATRDRVEPSFIEVKLAAPESAGTADATLAFSAVATSVGLSIATLDVQGQPYSFDGTLSLEVRPGRIADSNRITVEDGVWSGSMAFEAAFGPTRIWAKDEDVDDDRVPSWSAGVSDPLWYSKPTIAEMQGTDNHETNQLAGEFAELRVEDRQVVVTAIDAAGFWVSDLIDAPGNYSGLYAYTFQKPAEEVVIGARLTLLTGQNQEYLAATQISFPTLEVADGETLVPPPAFELTDAVCGNDDEMEKLEGSLVVANAPTIPASFTTDSAAFIEFVDYGQWPLTVGSCELYVESGATVPDYYPPDHAGETLTSVQGMLKEVYGKWIFIILGAGSIADPLHPTSSDPA